jgi:hypothetical protein
MPSVAGPGLPLGSIPLTTIKELIRRGAIICLIAPLVQACGPQANTSFNNTEALQGGSAAAVSSYSSERRDDGLVAQFGCKKNFTTTKETGLVANRTKAGDTHYIEFRVRTSPALPSGHLHVVYGELNEKSTPSTFNYIGLLPKGSAFGLYAGIFIPVAISGELQPSILDCSLKPDSAFRVSLDGAQYQKLLNRVAKARNDPPDWRMLSYNCNHFAADLGKSVGLKAPIGVRSRQFFSTIYFRQYLRANGVKVAPPPPDSNRA